jgi:alanine racemase
MHRTKAIINLDQYRKNLINIKNKLSPNTKIMAVVKANAYGHGLIPISKEATKAGVDYLAVAWLLEAIELREAGIKTPILLLSEPIKTLAQKVISFNVTQTIYTLDYAIALNKQAIKLNKKAKVHIKIDTGMTRLGVPYKSGLSFIEKISNLENIEIEGIFTHFANASEPTSSYTTKQLNRFNSLLQELEKIKIIIPIKHAANSSGTEHFPKSHFDLVRIGLASYENVLSLVGYLGHYEFVKKGTPVSYGCTYCLKQDTFVGIIFSGYADGIPQTLSNRGSVLIKDKKYPIIGQVCMDMLIVNLGNTLPKLNIPTEAIFIGSNMHSKILLDDVCKNSNKIPYEVMCGIGFRTLKEYIY